MFENFVNLRSRPILLLSIQLWENSALLLLLCKRKEKENRIKSWKIRQSGNLLISFVHSLGEGTRPTRGHTKSASISAGHRSSSGVPPSDHSLLDPQPRNAHNSLLATADPLRQRYRPPQCPSNTRTK